MTLVHLHQRASDGETKGTSLTADATALEIRLDVELATCSGGGVRLLALVHDHPTREVVTDRAPVDVQVARSRLHVNTADRFLAVSDRSTLLRMTQQLLRAL